MVQKALCNLMQKALKDANEFKNWNIILKIEIWENQPIHVSDAYG